MEHTTGTLGTRFRVTQPPLGFMHLTETPGALYIAGDTQTGIVLCFQQCMTEKTMVVTIWYVGQGISPPCGELRIEPAPGASNIESVTCEGDVEVAYARPMTINSDGYSCLCGYVGKTLLGPERILRKVSSENNFCAGVPVSESTWGSIKALYR